MTETMLIELLGGPADGMILSVPANAKIWLVPTPMMSPAEFIALESGQSWPEAVLPAVDHIYVWTRGHSRRTLNRIFHYSGPKTRSS